MLRISLRDGERIIINGAVLCASGRMTFDVQNDSAVLRGRDVMRPEEANTPARRLYFACMMAYIEPGRIDVHRADVMVLAGQLFAALANPDMRRHCVDVMTRLDEGQCYKALVVCRILIRYEGARLLRSIDGDAGRAGGRVAC